MDYDLNQWAVFVALLIGSLCLSVAFQDNVMRALRWEHQLLLDKVAMDLAPIPMTEALQPYIKAIATCFVVTIVLVMVFGIGAVYAGVLADRFMGSVMVLLIILPLAFNLGRIAEKWRGLPHDNFK